ncbi:bifunctional glycosyltransferase family 2 protein/CDP-glycerol:glycerophosphate glycerophosphotransferase [Lactiplantibacillus xiangfangensis]|uniref:Glycosyl glycerophosphate transferase n=1 Tax=Lactiplantibacillus xiangfangensis TaxID=942150 RepID=A0A0R2M7U9_9LACO|nr:bifunctional glycosyltransferase family 2 protein/CDP-glycerol:glycerophosphate glycerophosphotransferase [Lactiplantibacillus xiangfangensis]KRO08075.1 glycosyl glycerophosphate transferase [Lactiplantibacillus xiangfangensis]
MFYSLITPCLPNELEQLLVLKNNLTRQTMTDFEWLIACNQPIDLTQPKWQAPFPIRQITFTPATVGAARNQAMQAANGDWLVFVDSDDYLLPNALADAAAIISTRSTDVLYDLNQYPTYEPHSAFATSHEADGTRDDLPKWGGRKRNRPKRHTVNLPADALLPADLSVDPLVMNWLQHRYLEHTGEQRWAGLNRQLKVAGKIVARQLVEAQALKFNEDNPLYPDAPFMLPLIAATTSTIRLSQHTYVRVKHNDPINHPSVHQLDDPTRWTKRVQDWQTALATQTPDSEGFNKYAVRALHRLHRYLYAALATRTGTVAEEQRAELLPTLQRFLNDIPETLIKETLRGQSRRVLLTIRRNGSLPQRSVNRIVRLRELNRVLHRRGRGITKLAYNWWFTKLPIKPKTIFYESFLGRNYSDSPKAIYEYLQRTYPGKFHHVWIMNKGVEPNPGHNPNTTVVKRFGWRYMYYLATSKFQVINMRQPKWFIKRPGTKFLSTWHGTPLKHLVFDMDNVASANPLYKEIFYHQSRQWDNLIAANQFSVDVFEHAFMYPTDRMLKSGYPRNDILNAPDKAERTRAIKEKLGIPLDKKIILYAPTWRDDDYYGVGDYKFTLKLDIARLRRELGDDYVLVLRTHYFITEHLDTTDFGDFVYNESSYSDISELYLISDVLITDYSSVFFDYAILKRPILYFVYDYEKYGSVLRGFYLNMEKDLPGPLLKTNDDVLAALHDLPALNREYADAYRKFSERFNAWEDGHASERVVNDFFGDALPAPRTK